ncbi:hypothetical protein GCM10027040_05290 [Halomonas shantousis]
MFVPARHPSPIGRTAPRVGDGPAVTPRAATVDGGVGVDCRAGRQMGARVGQGHACPEPRALRERACRCLQGRDYGSAALLYAQAEHLTRMLYPESSDPLELAVLAHHCQTQAAQHTR